METLDDNSFNSSELSAQAIQNIGKTGRSMRFVAIFTIVISILAIALLVLGGASNIMAFSTISNNPYGGSGLLTVFITIIAIAIIIIGFQIYMSLQLLYAGNAFRDYERDRDNAALELGFRKQKLFWKILGIIIAIGLGLYALSVLVGILGSGF